MDESISINGDMDTLRDRRALALDRHQRGDLDGAQRRCREILAEVPDDGETWHYLAVLSGQQEQPAEVVKYCREALRCGYSSASLYANCGLAQQALGDDEGARSAFHESLALDPSDADLTLEYIHLLQAAGDELEAHRRLLGAVDRFPLDVRLHTALGQLAAELNDGQQAEAALREAARLDSESAESWLNLGSILQMRGDAAGAEAAFRRALARDAESAVAYWYLAQMGGAERDPALASHIIARAAAPTSAAATRSAPIHFAAGQVHHEAGRTAAAFAAYAHGNRLIRQGFEYSVSQDIMAMNRLLGRFLDGESLPPLPAQEEDSPTPVFIVGMPRSGSTLIEQMLARHPEVSSGGEIVWLQRHLRQALRTAGLNYPADQLMLGDAALASVGQRYRAAVHARQQGLGGRFMTDKLPANFLCIPTIRRLFPGALIIHARRDPLETGWSCYRHLFTGRQSFAYDLVELGQYTRAVHHFMDVCRALWPESIVELSYEVLIDDPETPMRALLQRLGLAWDSRVLAPEATPNLIRTASALQVRRGISATPLGSAGRYAEWLQPFDQNR